MKVTRRAKRRIYSPRRDARALWQMALSRLAEDLKDSVLARIDAQVSLTKGIADLIQEELRYALYESVVRPEVARLLAGDRAVVMVLPAPGKPE